MHCVTSIGKKLTTFTDLKPTEEEVGHLIRPINIFKLKLKIIFPGIVALTNAAHELFK